MRSASRRRLGFITCPMVMALVLVLVMTFAGPRGARAQDVTAGTPTISPSLRLLSVNSAAGDRNLGPGDTVAAYRAVIGEDTLLAYRIIERMPTATSPDTIYGAVLSHLTTLGDRETIHTACLRDFFLARVARPLVISYGCTGGIASRPRLTSPAAVDDYMGGFRTAGTASLSLDGDEAGLYSELASDKLFLWASAGFARVGFGALVSAAASESDPENGEEGENGGDSEEDAATTVNQFYQGGGNASVYLAYPLQYWRNYIQPFTGVDPTFVRRGDMFLTLVVSADIPDMGMSVENPAMNGRLGLQTTYTHNTFGEAFNFYLHLDGSLGVGSKQFFANLGSPSKSQTFAVGQAGVGLEINRLVRIGVVTGASSMGAHLDPRLSIKLISNQ